MNAKNGIMACILCIILLSFGIFLYQYCHGSLVGSGCVVTSPAAQAVYTDNGREALDDEALYGMTGSIVSDPDADDRYLVRTRYNLQLRIDKDDLRIDSAAVQAWEQAAGHCVAAPFADIVPAPELKAFPPLLTLPRGALLPVLGEAGEYYRIGLADGSTGYVRQSALRKLRAWGEADEATTRTRLVEDAKSYLGAPYRWGGKTPAGIDCSGLASIAYMLNGLFIYRNSRPLPGFPVALLHVETPASGKHTRNTLVGVKPGDLIYWEGHEGVYVGEGRYIHANATTFAVGINSLVEGDADYLPELADPVAILAWGTAFPGEPGKLIVRRLTAVPQGEPRVYRFRAGVDGYAPTSAVLYPEGEGDGKPALEIDDPGRLLYESVTPEKGRPVEYRYAKPGAYRPAIRFSNRTGWLPNGSPTESDMYIVPEPIVVE